MDSLFSIDAKHIYLMLQVLFPVTLVWEAVVSFIGHVTRPWRDLFWICFDIYLNLWTGIGSFSMKMLVLPLRIYNAIQREDMVCDYLTNSSLGFQQSTCVIEHLFNLTFGVLRYISYHLGCILNIASPEHIIVSPNAPNFPLFLQIPLIKPPQREKGLNCSYNCPNITYNNS